MRSTPIIKLFHGEVPMWAFIGLAGLVLFELGWLRTQYFLSALPIGLSKTQVMRMMKNDPPMGSYIHIDGTSQTRHNIYSLYTRMCM